MLLMNEVTIENYLPFDPVTKRSEAKVFDGKERFKAVKGAPQAILNLCPNKFVIQSSVTKVVDAFAARGFGSLAVAKTAGESSWSFLGILPLYDPPREDSAEMIQQANNMSISVKMITGDHRSIAQEISKQLNLGENISTAEDLREMKQWKLGDLVEGTDGFYDYLSRKGRLPFWTRPFPSAKLFWASELTQVVATFFAVYGWFMKPIGWELALLVWGYALT